jgi:hypothetical protein
MVVSNSHSTEDVFKVKYLRCITADQLNYDSDKFVRGAGKHELKLTDFITLDK